jgi:hypothetical protein
MAGICAALMAGSGAESAQPGSRSTRESRERQAKSAKLVDRALRERAAGNAAETRKLLDLALELAPDYAPVHWHRGEIWHHGRWLTVSMFQGLAAADPSGSEYARQRSEYMRASEPIALNYPTGASPAADAPRYLQVPSQTPRYLRKAFELPGKPSSAQLHIVAVGQCEVFINGHAALQSHRERNLGHTSVEKLLRSGTNVIAISLGALKSQQVPGFYGRLEGVSTDQRVFAIPSDFTWKVAVRELDGWKNSDFDDATWETVVPPPVDLPPDGAVVVPNISAALELALAKWCKSHDLPVQSAFHWMRLLSVQPQQPEAMKALGLVRYGDAVMTREQVEVEKKAEREAKYALARWLPILRKVLAEFQTGSARRADAARARLRQADATSLEAFETIIAEADAKDGATAEFITEYVNSVLPGLLSDEATELLLRLACDHPLESVRSVAVAVLKPRDQTTFLPQLLMWLEEPTSLNTSISQNEKGEAICRAEYSRLGPDKVEERTERREFAEPTNVKDSKPGNVGKGGRAEERDNKDKKGEIDGKASLRLASEHAAKLEFDVAEHNQQVMMKNARLFGVLTELTGQQLAAIPHAWWNWWKSDNEILVPPPKPGRKGDSIGDQFQRYQSALGSVNECFAKGTPVWTSTGLRPIELINPGDLVLACNPETGELAFKAVWGTALRPPGALLAIRIDDETLTSTRGHRYWQEGRGWRMAKSLQADDRLHGVEEGIVIRDVSAAPEQPACKLVVEGFHSYFVGRTGVLVQDTGAPLPTKATTPGLVN